MLKEEHIDLEDEVAAGITEYRFPDRRRMKRQRKAYEEAEREQRENESNNRGNSAGDR